MATKKYRSDALRSAHKAMEGLYQVGLVDQKTMREFDVRCLVAAR